MSEVHDREREARQRIDGMIATGTTWMWAKWRERLNAELDAYRDAVEARVRWDQQAQAVAVDVDPGAAR